MNGKPLITLDLDGVVCRPPFGRNYGIRRGLGLPPLPANIDLAPNGTGQSFLSGLLHALRYIGRRPLDDAKEGLLALRAMREPVLVTARGVSALGLVEAWLRRHGLYDCFSAVYANDTVLRPAQFKLHKVRSLQAAEHVDDDGSTVYYLATNGVKRIYLRDWPRNRGLPYPPNVIAVRTLVELAERVSRGS